MPAGIYEYDSMFSVRETPWHGLGAVLDEYPNGIDEALDASGLSWRVDQAPLYAGLPMTQHRGYHVPIFESRLHELPEYRANIREDTGEVLGVVSDAYTVVQNEDAFRFLDSLINSDLHFETAGSIKNGRKVWVLVRRPEWIEVGGDETATYIYVANSHDGSMSVTAAVTPIRIVCQNTLGAALSRAKQTYKFRHTGDLQEKFDEARTVLGLTINYEEQFKAMGDELAREPISLDTFDSKVTKPLFGLDRPEDLGKRALSGREQQRELVNALFTGNGPAGDTTGNSPGTKWTAYNAVAEYADHGRRVTKRTDQIQRSFEDADLKREGLALVRSA